MISRFGLAVAAALVIGGLPGLAAAQQAPVGNVANGKRLSGAMCASCHVVVPGGSGGWTDAPYFPAIAAQAKVTRPWLTAFFAKPHIDMLYTDRPPRTRRRTSAAYILSLKRR